MSKIEGVFSAKASSVHDTFLCHNGVASFRIPIYQRRYDWPKENIHRLFEDILNGLISLKDDEEVLTFIGTIIVVNEETTQENSFNGKSLAVVDGQQRLTTLSLIGCSLQQALFSLKESCSTLSISQTSKDWLLEEIEFSINLLFECVVGRPSSRRISGRYALFPRIVRQNYDDRGQTASEATYSSLIAKYLHDFGNEAEGDAYNGQFKFSVPANNNDADSFQENVNIINGVVEQISSGEAFDQPIFSIDDISRKGYRDLLNKWGDNVDHFNNISGELRRCRLDVVERIVRLILFSNYLLDRVALTRVEASEERYAFDIFEALNTTGEPLTAIETFKPRVIEYEQRGQSKYAGSPSEDYFRGIDQYLNSFRRTEDKQSSSRDVVVSFGLYKTGKKLPKHLAQQRHYLRSNYDKIKDEEVEGKREYVKSLLDVVRFRKDFWGKSLEAADLISLPVEERELAIFCLAFIKDMKTTLAIPLLTRYRRAAEEIGDPYLFFRAIKSVTAFLALRRAATNGTAGIDTDFRYVMSKGNRTKLDIEKKLAVGLGKWAAPVSIAELNNYLKSYLSASKLGIYDKEKWVERVIQQPMYSSSTTLCRFMLLTASTHAISSSKPGHLEIGRGGHNDNYMTLRAWQSDDFGTVEHVAPDSKSTEWSAEIYSDAYTRHSIGNLTLLPSIENMRAGNKPWQEKRRLYAAFAARDEKDLEAALKVISKSGKDVGPKAIKYLKDEASALPFVESLSHVEKWDKDFIFSRSENIANLVWKQIAEWLDFDV